jgi:type I restriction enzyme S subunit
LQSRSKKTSGQQNLTIELCKQLPTPLPPLPEQRKIAQILSTWDQAIAATVRLFENSQQRQKGLMQQLLKGKKRLLGFEREWECKEIGQILAESRVPSDTDDPTKRLTVRLNLKGIEQREFRRTEARGATGHYVRFAGQFIYGKQNIHKAALGLIPNEFDRHETSQDLPAFDFKEGVSSHWFLYFCSQDWFYTDLEKKMTGTGSKRLNPKTFLKVKIPTPPCEEQEAIAKVLDLASRDVSALKQQLDLLKEEKKALMQQLLTGKRRVQVEAA